MPSKNTINEERDLLLIKVTSTAKSIGASKDKPRTMIGKASVRADYLDEIQSVSWSVSNGYLRNDELGMLHKYIIGKWYDSGLREDMQKQGFIIEHLNGDKMDCQISNLYFLHQDENTAKGQTLDRAFSSNAPQEVALRIYKDVTTGAFQITFTFNFPLPVCQLPDLKTPIQDVRLLYGSDIDYRLVIADAKLILLEWELSKRIPISRLHHRDIKKEFVTIMTGVPPNLLDYGTITTPDGKTYYNSDSPTCAMQSIPFEPGWK